MAFQSEVPQNSFIYLRISTVFRYGVLLITKYLYIVIYDKHYSTHTLALKISTIGSFIPHIKPVSKTQKAPTVCAKQVRVTAVGERKVWRLNSPLQVTAGCYFNVVFRLLIENKVKILLFRFVEINVYTFVNVACFSLQLHYNYKITVTANFSHNFLFVGFSGLPKQFFSGSHICFFSKYNSTQNFMYPREYLYTKLILSVCNNRSTN
jgi:hypothetical protein